MKVAEEYKDTKIGRIPKDWEVVKLGETCEFYRGQPFAKSEIDENGIHECIHYGELFTVYSEIIRTIHSKTNSEVIRASKFGDVLMPSSDVTPIGLATASVINKDGVLIGGDVNIIRPILKLNSNYLSYLINHEKKKIIRLISGTNVKHIYNRNIKTLLYALPPLSEQQKIAEILSTVDEQISTTQAIIDKSKELKKGLMQKLFSEGIGHTEFKDTKIGRIPKDWKVAMLKDVAKVITSGFSFDVFEKSKLDSGVEVLFTKVSDMNLKGNERIISDSVNKGFFADDFVSSNSVLKPNSLIFPKRGAAIKTNKKRINEKHIILDPNLIAVSFDEKGKVNYLFTYYYFISFDLMRIVEDGTIPQLNKRDIEPFKIPLPSIEEQQKIADILSEADAKIEKEEQEKAQLEQLKKGLMQQLLTGQKRVKV